MLYLPKSPIWSTGSPVSEDGLDYDEQNRNPYALQRSSKLVQYEENDDNESLQMRLLIAKLTSFTIGNATDPFCSLPQWKNPELDSVWLLRKSK